MEKLVLTWYWHVLILSVILLPIILGLHNPFKETYSVVDVEIQKYECVKCHNNVYKVSYTYLDRYGERQTGKETHIESYSQAEEYRNKLYMNGYIRTGGGLIFLISFVWSIIAILIGFGIDTLLEGQVYVLDRCNGCPIKGVCPNVDSSDFTDEAWEKARIFLGKE